MIELLRTNYNMIIYTNQNMPPLPDEIWLQILSNFKLDPSALILTSLCCRKLYQLTSGLNPKLLRILIFIKSCLKVHVFTKIDYIENIKCAFSRNAIAIINGKTKLLIHSQFNQKAINLEYSRYEMPENFLQVAFITDSKLFILTDRRQMIYTIDESRFSKDLEIFHPRKKKQLFMIKYSKENTGIAFAPIKGHIFVHTAKLKRKIIISKKDYLKGMTVQKEFAAILLRKKSKRKLFTNGSDSWVVGIYELKNSFNIILGLAERCNFNAGILSNRKWIVVHTLNSFYVIDPYHRLKKEFKNFCVESNVKFFLSHNHLVIAEENTVCNETIFTTWNVKKGKKVDSRKFSAVQSFDCHQEIMAMVHKPNGQQDGQQLSFWHLKDKRNLHSISLPKNEIFNFIKFRNKHSLIIETNKNIYLKNVSLLK